jgi:hypothetical protein
MYIPLNPIFLVFSMLIDAKTLPESSIHSFFILLLVFFRNSLKSIGLQVAYLGSDCIS